MAMKKRIPSPTNFGKNLRTLRTGKGIGQGALAAELGLTRQKIASYETGIVEPNASVFLAICAWFDIRPSRMLNEMVEDPGPHTPVSETPSSKRRPADKGELIKALNKLSLDTGEFSRILDGYETLRSTKIGMERSEDEGALFSLYEDLLSVMHMLTEANKRFFESVPSNQ